MVFETFTLGSDPDLDAIDWTDLPTMLAVRGLLGRPGLAVAALSWHDAGKVDYPLGGQMPVLCLSKDPREYGLIAPRSGYVGRDLLIVAPRRTLQNVADEYGESFDSITPITAVVIRHAGRAAMIVPLFIGRNFHPGADLAARRVAGPAG